MEELTRLRGDRPFGWLEALRRLWFGRPVRKAAPRHASDEPRRPLLPADLHHLAAPR